jgi:hypothetical protein
LGFSSTFFVFILLPACALASWDVGTDLNTAIGGRTEGKVKLIFEFRSRLEDRTGQSFGLDRDLFANFTRIRFGMSYKPVSWIRITGVALDTRTQLYGAPAPATARDPLDLHEGYVEIRPDQKAGFGSIAGRMQANYGDTRLIGSPQWAFIPRTYDGARVFWRNARYRFEALVLSPVKLNSLQWNQPVLGERVEGTYNSLTIQKHLTVEPYYLRHQQNRPGGFTGVGRLTTNSFGARLFGPLAHGFRYSAEGVAQTGKIGLLPHRAEAWAVQIGRQFPLLGKPLDFIMEYKYASGGSRTDRSETFDALFPAAHDKFGHADLLGWRNVRNVKSFGTWSVTKPVTIYAMYNNSWLADARDAAYNTQGRAIARSPLGIAGTHIGQEADIYASYKRSGWTFGAGYGHFFPGEFMKRTTPGASPHLAYVYQSYSF